MKRGTPRHRKMRALARLLGIPLPHAVGIMEMIWHWAGQETPQGDIGTATDREIANACDWMKRPDVLVSALVESGWLDLSPTHRLTIHDWHQHADQAVRKWLARREQDFLPIYGQISGQRPDAYPDESPDIVQQNGSPRAQARPELAGLGSSSEFSVSSENSEGKDWKKLKFEEFWRIVWAKIGKGAAEKVWLRNVKTKEMADSVIAAASIQGPRLLEHAQKYEHSVLHPATWISAHRWEDEEVVLPETQQQESITGW